jgi:hypothetical protein
MVSASQIRESVMRYLSHGDSDKFVLEFGALSYNIHADGDGEAASLVRAIEFEMADFRSGCIAKDAFLRGLKSLIDISVASNCRVFAQFSDPVNRQLEVAGFRGWAPSGTAPAVGFGSVHLVQS